MRIVCAWCGADLGTKPGPADKVTHGCCERCMAKMLDELDGGSASSIPVTEPRQEKQ